jgi:nicotinamide riboside kinase
MGGQNYKIDMEMTEKKKIKIICTGPESTGKSTLSEYLANVLKSLWVPEFARTYLTHLGRAYQATDLTHILRGQYAWEHWYEQNLQPGQPLICDTDWTVVYVWKKYVFNAVFQPPLEDLKDRFYLLCAPDLPWEPDPLREHPDARDVLFQAYTKLLDDIGAEYRVVSGSLEERNSNALDILKSKGLI